MENKTFHASEFGGLHALVTLVGAAGDLGGTAPGFCLSKRNKTLQLYPFLGFFGTVLFVLLSLLCSLLAIFSFLTSLSSHHFPGRFPRVWPWDFGFHSEEASEILQNLT